MVFWSSWAKKVRESVSKLTFDKLKNRVDTIENVNQTQDTKINNNTNNITQLQSTTTQHTQSINTNTSNISNNSNKITNVDNKVDSVIQGLQNGHIINYAGEWNSTTNYNIAQAVTYGGDWFVSNQNNNVGHTPTKTINAYWVYISAPNVDLTPYLTIDNATATYATISTVNGLDTRINTNQNNISSLQTSKADKTQLDNYILKTMLNTMFPIGSCVMTSDGSEHALVTMYRSKFRELTDSDLSYLAIGSGSAGTSNTGTFTIQQNNLPNIYWNWDWYWNNGITSNETDFNINHSPNMTSTYQYIQTNRKNSSQANNSGARVNVRSTIYLNGNVNQIPIQYTIKPKTKKIRMWEVTANLI